jgi:YggT family protein
VVVFEVLNFILTIFWLLLIGRIVVEAIGSFARDWRPTGLLVVVLETVFTVTDPPVKLLRRLVPSVSIGGLRLDLGIFVLFLLVFLLMNVVRTLALSQSPV